MTQNKIWNSVTVTFSPPPTRLPSWGIPGWIDLISFVAPAGCQQLSVRPDVVQWLGLNWFVY
jgi:hypothetical protein